MSDPYGDRQERMVDRLVEDGILRSDRAIAAMREVPRHLFVPERYRESAYLDTPLSIGLGQTISAPHMVAMMLESLDLESGHHVLEIGGGSGYHAALVGHMVGGSGHVYSVERIESLARQARQRVQTVGLEDRVTILVGDGSQGAAEHAPYDRIFVTCGAPAIPGPLEAQLKEGGRLLIPVGSRYYQDLVRAEKVEGRLRRENLGGCVFVPLVGEHGFS